MLALALILDGHSRAAAAQAVGMDRQTLRDWVHRYNERGLEGLTNTWGGGRKALLDAPPTERLAELVRQGPDPVEHGVVRWRRVDLESFSLDPNHGACPTRGWSDSPCWLGWRPAGWPRPM